MSKVGQSETISWQKELLPFMKWVIGIGAAITLILVAFNMAAVYSFVKYDEQSVVEQYLKDNPYNYGPEVIKAMARLDEESLVRRHQFARISILTTTIMKFIGFIIGFILSVFGTVFVLGKINLEKETEIKTGEKLGNLSFKSTSPGLVMIFLGVVLIGFMSQISNMADISDGSNYLPQFHWEDKYLQLDSLRNDHDGRNESDINSSNNRPEVFPDTVGF
jgi:hypothetical protein